MRYTHLLALFIISFSLQAQVIIDAPDLRVLDAVKATELNQNSMFADYPAKNIGPTVFSGRVTAISVNPKNPTEFFVGYATGGLWHTKSNGTKFKPLFSHEMSHTIGHFDVNWDTGEIWLGSGEVNSSRSSYAGIGIFYSADMGKNWEFKGLPMTQHIGKVIIDPNDTNTVYVASMGALYSESDFRGLYKTTDKGRTWKKILDIDNKTGIIDLILDPTNSKRLIASAWERSRKAWNFVEGGNGSGIYMSEDSGNTWTEIALSTSGFPNHELLGRIGLAMGYDGTTPVLYALIDNYKNQPTDPTSKDKINGRDFKTMDKATFLALNDDDLDAFLKNNRFDKAMKSSVIKSMIKTDSIPVSALYDYLYDSNTLLLESPVIGAELYMTKDFGKTWTKTHEQFLDYVYRSYGYYFGVIGTIADKPSTVYIAGVPIWKSEDYGKTFENVNGDNVHVDHHALWINPENNDHLINGNDGGINISYDGGKTYYKCNSPSVGQFYTVNVDYQKDYNVYGGTQDNGVWMGSNNYEFSDSWQSTGKYPYELIQWGDGMEVQIDKRNSDVVYTGYQYGNYFRLNISSKKRTYITPKHELGQNKYRWNWQSPILLSSHNQDIFYMGSNKLHRSMDQGSNFIEISDDLTNGGKVGDVSYGTLTNISESPFKFGMIYTGSDDGAVNLTTDGGNTWKRLDNDLPQNLWVSKVKASEHVKNRVYLSLNGYRNDDFKPYLYVSNNNGTTWTSISEDLPMEPINTVIEDSKDKNIIYVGTDNGCYVSFDGGKTFDILSNEIPRVPVHDLVIQTVANDLIVATHGRSFYKVNLDGLHNANKNSFKNLWANSDTLRLRNSGWGENNIYGKMNEPKDSILVFFPDSGDIQASYQIELLDDKNKTLAEKNATTSKGYKYVSIPHKVDANRIRYYQKQLKNKDLDEKAENSAYLQAGKYTLKIKQMGNEVSVPIIIK